MKSRSPIRNWLEYLLARTFFAVLAVLPNRLSLRVARASTHALRVLVPRLSQIARRNLALTGIATNRAAQDRMVAGVFDSIARLLWVTAKSSRIFLRDEAKWKSALEKFVVIEGMEWVRQANRACRGILFATGHVGAWELSALTYGALVLPMDVIARPLDNPLLDRWVTRIRERSGNQVLAKSGTLREVFRALERNRAVGFLVDHNVISSDLCFIRFLDVQASASTVFAKLAVRTGATVIPGFCVWEEAQQRFVLRFYPPVELTGFVVADTQRIHDRLEAVIRQYPEQWLWIHRRFKTRPPGEADLYQNLGVDPEIGKEGLT